MDFSLVDPISSELLYDMYKTIGNRVVLNYLKTQCECSLSYVYVVSEMNFPALYLTYNCFRGSVYFDYYLMYGIVYVFLM